MHQCFSLQFKRTEETENLLKKIRIFLLDNGIKCHVNCYHYRIVLNINKMRSCHKLIKLLDHKLILKKNSLIIWKQILDLRRKERSHTIDGFLKIVRLRDEMSKYQKNKHKHDYNYYRRKLLGINQNLV